MIVEEQVLCLERSTIPQEWCNQRTIAIPMSWKLFSEASQNTNAIFLNRSQAERMPDYKQLIPYVIIRGSNQNIAVYCRQGTEKRLRGSWSAGIGGHIIRQDQERGSWQDSIHAGMYREMQEELPGLQEEPVFLGLINEEESEVGKVHLGLVFLLECKNLPAQYSPELQNLRWLEKSKIAGKAFELWSRLAISLVP